MKAYSEDIRLRVIQSYNNGEGSQRQLARRYSVSLSFVHELLKRYRQTGNIVPRKHIKKVDSKVDDNSLRLILNLVDNDPQLPLSRLCERLAQERQLHISRATMWRTLRKHRPYKTMLRLATRNSQPRQSVAPPS